MLHNPLATNPAELALPYVEAVTSRESLDVTPEEERVLAELDVLTVEAEMNGYYFTSAGKALAVPISFEPDGRVKYVDFGSLAFEGNPATYSIVGIASILGRSSIRALCLTFDKVTLLPFFDSLPEDLLLHVPALAVDSMIRTDVSS